jgi:hypothetical protein
VLIVVVEGMMVIEPFVPDVVLPPPEPESVNRDVWLLEHAAKAARPNTQPT